jgi:hypothetical protein
MICSILFDLCFDSIPDIEGLTRESPLERHNECRLGDCLATADDSAGAAPPAAGNNSRWTQLRRHEDKVLLLLTLIIGATVGLVVVAFILLTERLGSRLYPANAAAWRRFAIPFAGALSTGFLLARYFPNARGSGIPQTSARFLENSACAR